MSVIEAFSVCFFFCLHLLSHYSSPRFSFLLSFLISLFNSLQLHSTLPYSTPHHSAPGGENISSIEVEAILLTHHMIDEAAVIAVADEKWGEVPCAFVTLRTDSGAQGLVPGSIPGDG
jgi:AMP-binding enzyme C-terminal domain